MKKWRAKPYDIVNDIWILQERFLVVFWVYRGVGKRSVIEQQASQLNEPS